MTQRDYFKTGLAAAFPAPSQLSCSDIYKQMGISFSNLKQIEELRNSNDDGLGLGLSPQRIAALQDRLEAHQYIMVEKSGKWPGEYVARSEERLYWLTDFSGSAGACLIGKHHAMLFIDGRYPNQARREAPHMTIMTVDDQSMLEWLKQNTDENNELLFDGYSMPIATYESFADELSLKLTSQSTFLVDMLWKERFGDPKGPIWAHSLEYAGQSFVEKIEYYCKALEEHDLDGFVITAPENIAWLLNIRGCDVKTTPIPLTFATVWRNGTVDWYVDGERFFENVLPSLKSRVKIYPYMDFFALDGSFNHQDKRMGFDARTTTLAVHQRLNEDALNLADPCLLPKACKNAVEQEGMRQAHILDGVIMARFLCELNRVVASNKITEMEAAEALDALRLQQPLCPSISFETISASGENAALPHYHPSAKNAKTIDFDQVYLVDSGGQYFFGTTDITRSMKFTTGSEMEVKAYTLVLKGFIDLMRDHFPRETTAYVLDDIARAPLNREGMDYQHGTGHGVGSYLGVHEGPVSIANREASKKPLHAGMVMSIEPGYYLEGSFGFRIENLVIVQEDNEGLFFENLTLCPIDKMLIDKNLLEDVQIKWLNDYHQQVWEKISPLLERDKATLAWLEQACAAL